MIKVEKTPPFHQHDTKHHNRQNNQRVINRMGWHRVDTIERIPLPNTKLRIPLHKPYQWYNIPRHNTYQWYDTTPQSIPKVQYQATMRTTLPSVPTLPFPCMHTFITLRIPSHNTTYQAAMFTLSTSYAQFGSD